MYGTGLLRSARHLRRQKIVTLLYDSRKNDALITPKSGRQYIWAVLSGSTVILGFVLVQQGLKAQTNSAWLYLAAAACCMLSGVYGLYRQVPLFILTLAYKNERLRYQSEMLFYLGQLRDVYKRQAERESGSDPYT